MKLDAVSKTYLRTTVALLVLLALTIGAAFINLGPINTIVALTISVAKGLLIILFFMHVRDSNPLIRVAVVTGFFWLGIMFALSLSDFMTRGWK